jgi:hypothetical protein
MNHLALHGDLHDILFRQRFCERVLSVFCVYRLYMGRAVYDEIHDEWWDMIPGLLV